MVEINNQRKAFLDMLAWSEELITDVRKPEIMVMTSLQGGELFTDYPDHPRKLVTLNPKLKSTGAGRYQLFRWWTSPQRSWPERLSESQGRCGIAADYEPWRFYRRLIVVISVRQSTVAAISGLHRRALVMVSSSIRLTA